MTDDQRWQACLNWVASDDPPPGERLGWPVAARIILGASLALWVVLCAVAEVVT